MILTFPFSVCLLFAFCFLPFAVLKDRVTNAEAGYTTIELLIAMQLAFLLCGFIYGAVHFSERLTGEWQKRIRTEAALAVVIQNLQRDLTQADRILQAGEHELVLLNQKQNTIVYRVEDGRVWRNERNLTHLDTQSMLGFKYQRMAVARGMIGFGTPELQEFVPQAKSELKEIVLIEAEIVLAEGGKRWQMRTAVHLRNARLQLYDSL